MQNTETQNQAGISEWHHNIAQLRTNLNVATKLSLLTKTGLFKCFLYKASQSQINLFASHINQQEQNWDWSDCNITAISNLNLATLFASVGKHQCLLEQNYFWIMNWERLRFVCSNKVGCHIQIIFELNFNYCVLTFWKKRCFECMQVGKFYLCVGFSHIYCLNTNNAGRCNWTQKYMQQERRHLALEVTMRKHE